LLAWQDDFSGQTEKYYMTDDIPHSHHGDPDNLG
jgi:hypothetical protein